MFKAKIFFKSEPQKGGFFRISKITPKGLVIAKEIRPPKRKGKKDKGPKRITGPFFEPKPKKKIIKEKFKKKK